MCSLVLELDLHNGAKGRPLRLADLPNRRILTSLSSLQKHSLETASPCSASPELLKVRLELQFAVEGLRNAAEAGSQDAQRPDLVMTAAHRGGEGQAQRFSKQQVVPQSAVPDGRGTGPQEKQPGCALWSGHSAQTDAAEDKRRSLTSPRCHQAPTAVPTREERMVYQIWRSTK